MSCTIFTIPKGLTPKALMSQLGERFVVEEESAESAVQTFYDTFDWRLYNEKAYLYSQSEGTENHVYWLPMESERAELKTAIPKTMPGFVGEFPKGELADRLAPIMEMRTLLPQVKIDTHYTRLRILDHEQKTRVRLVLNKPSMRPIGGSGRTKALATTLRLVELKGYSKNYEQVKSFLADKLKLVEDSKSLIQSALQAAGKSPGAYSNKIQLSLTPQMPANLAAKEILKYLLANIRVNEAGTKEALDSEFLHDFRVSIRRTRSALSQIKSVFPQSQLNRRYIPGFAWLGQITGPTRDLDVYLLKYEEYRDSLPVEAHTDLESLHQFLLDKQTSAQKALAKEISSARYKQLLTSWEQFLEQPAAKNTPLVNANRAVIDVANERIWKTYKRVLKEGGAIHADTPAEALHDLRKTCKKLRYLMEFFQSLYPDAKIKNLIKVLKGLQNNLGDFQDYEVQVEHLQRFGQEMLDAGGTTAATLMAMGMLTSDLIKLQHQARDEFAQRFSVFASDEHQREFRELFKRFAKVDANAAKQVAKGKEGANA